MHTWRMTTGGLLLIGAALAFCSPALGQEGPEWFLSPKLGNLQFSLTYDGAIYPDKDVKGQNADMGFVQNRVRFFAPITQNPEFEWAALGGVKSLNVQTDAVLPAAGVEFPENLWEVEFGTAVRGRLKNGWILGGDLIVGSPSDKPFASFDEMALQADALLRVPWKDGLAWIFLLNYSKFREVAPNFPLPGVILAYEPGSHLQALVGVPYSSVRWTPIEKLDLFASYFIVRTIRARASYKILEPLSLYVRFDWDSQRFLRHDRANEDDRLSYYEKRIGGGIRWDLTKNLQLDLSGGYAFDRFWFEGEDYGDRDKNRIDLNNGPFVSLRLGLRFQ